ncbi:protein NRT1/ PTR FAMILY 8.2 [Physcomitrium patens]|uniref:Uncharacterized protein n=1 Tax=Physcomitrium patens TaxID=3218 RepID=A0A2K1KMM9_PHYPA|nr:protein NRT1/ PTR FAMILY 8.4-like [Physcomitrium patens]XP_024372335.1 protein NRT1/ PTR FAMILY 8.4-like [Physcomitrium patens]XP_024372336.1 protein NRT1/ PTR FAMILY 8.4-like [Physcomitrium patens]XP_024372337.1 protein NRT1/ PTR FAMILY 8.4-like [Physcomitrium patens]XP_024372338.1 protein NRT1/ PTR FAMILY 8.4-like [Physcomitrium patens]XP_024372339.1 protein NRT1/ PTR FAMILY 8.4-like [Physcomitrium patens]PNR55021.1 hypothetical protein PHYPA_005914 [Physcomitrium patens]|eukprot:XP_024372334.1 protein NRT1/ PTR FAMILY 8.4-like [Physcomitrella patens]
MAFCGAACGVLPCVNRKGDDGRNVEGDYGEAPDRKAVGANFQVGDGSVDTKGRPASKENTGGWKTASLIFVAVMFESVASVGIAFTLFTYLSGPMHLPTSKASIHTNIYWGTSFITSIFGGFISDAYLGRFWASLIFAVMEMVGLGLMVVSVSVNTLAPNCPITDHTCPSLEGTKGFIVFLFALYLVALGTGCLRPCLATLGADQFDIEDPEEKRQIRSYFNWLFFFMSVGTMIAMMVVVYVSQSVSWFWAYTIMGIAMLLSTACLVAGAGHYRHKKPQGSPLTRIAQVIVAATRKKKTTLPSNSAMLFEVQDHENGNAIPTEPTLKRFNSNKGEVLGEPTLKRYYSLPHTEGLTFLDRAAVVTEHDTGTQSTTKVNPWRLCTITQVEELKAIMRTLPIVWCVSFLYIVVAQIQTWAVAQGYTMERNIGTFQFPPPSLSAISVAFVLIEIAVYDQWFVPFMRKYTKHTHGITHLQRIGIGLLQSILAMAYGAIVETGRLRSARHHGLIESPMAVVPMSIFWLLPMWILASSAELWAYVGLFEFYWQEMPVEMRSLGGGFSLLAIALGFYQSGGLIVVTNAVSKNYNNGGWLADSNLNKNRLNYFYLVLMVLSSMNAFGFVMSTKWYNYVKFINTKLTDTTDQEVPPSPMPDIFKRSESRLPLKSPRPSTGDQLQGTTPDSTPRKPKISADNKHDKGLPSSVKAGAEVDATLPDSLPRSESRTPLRSTNNSDDLPDLRFVGTTTPPPRSPRTIFSQVFLPRSDPPAAPQTADQSSSRFIKLERSRSRGPSK